MPRLPHWRVFTGDAHYCLKKKQPKHCWSKFLHAAGPLNKFNVPFWRLIWDDKIWQQALLPFTFGVLLTSLGHVQLERNGSRHERVHAHLAGIMKRKQRSEDAAVPHVAFNCCRFEGTASKRGCFSFLLAARYLHSGLRTRLLYCL